MKISYFKEGQYTKGDTIGEVVSLEKLIDIKTSNNIKYKSKDRLPFIQGQDTGYFMVKKDILSYKYYKNWDGVVFMDIDSPKNADGNVCDWWSDSVITNKLDDFAISLTKYKWFVGISISGGGHGWHVLGQIKSKWHSEEEYMATYIKVYNDIYSELQLLFQDKPISQIKKMCDGHNIYPYQKFFVGGKKFYINNNFDEDWSNDELDKYSTDYEYFINMKSNCDMFIVNQVVDQFNTNIISARTINVTKSKIDNVTYTTKYNLNTKYKPLYIDGVPYFNNVYRFMLVKTLKCFFNKTDAYNIAINIYDTYWKEGHDKRAAHEHIKQIINNEDPFEVKDWFIDVLIKIGVLSERPIYDKLYDMDEMGIDYLSDIMPQIIEESGDITIIDSPVASGKTTSIKNIKDSLWMAEPYNPVIKNNFDGLSDKFQCLYDDKQFDENSLTNTKNKIASSYNKLISVDSKVFIDKNIKYLFIDESHTIFSDCDFRQEIMYKLVNKIIEIGKENIKVFLMTGTPLKERELFGSCTDLDIKYIKVKRKHRYKKELFVYKYKTSIYDEVLNKEKKTGFVLEDFISKKIIEYKNKGYKILVPTNNGDKKIEKIMCRCSAINGYSVCDEEFNIYKRDYRNDEENKSISIGGNMQNDIVFCTTYLSVGVSINNTEPACIIFFGNDWTAYQIEQYACRFRNTDITVIWIVNNNKCDETTSNFKLVKIPSEDEISAIIESTERELKFRGWENWDIILHNTLNAYPGIIKENMFEMNKLYYDTVSLYLSWYVYSLKTYYMNFMNNIEELKKYQFDVHIEDIIEKSLTAVYKENMKEAIKILENEKAKKLLRWIDYINDYYFLQKKPELNFEGEPIDKEPFISFHRFAMYCWYNYLTIPNIKYILSSLITVETKGETNEYKRCLNSIELAKKSLEDAKSMPDNNKNKKRKIQNAENKLKKFTDRLNSFNITETYKISTSHISKYKQLIRIAKHYKYQNISRLVHIIKEEVDKIAIKNEVGVAYKLHNKEQIWNNIADIYNKICNTPDYIDYDKYKKELSKSIEKFVRVIYDVSEPPIGGIIIFKSALSESLPSDWFECDYTRQINSAPVTKTSLQIWKDISKF